MVTTPSDRYVALIDRELTTDHVQLQNLINEYFVEQCYNCERFKKLTKRGNKMATTRQKPRTKSTSRTKKTK